MNYKKAKSILKKLNTMLDSFQSLDEPLSEIESEMLMRYTEEFTLLIPQIVDEEEHDEEEEPVVAKPKKVKKPKKKAPAAKAASKAPVKKKAVAAKAPPTEEIPEVDETEEYEVPPVQVEEKVVTPPKKAPAKKPARKTLVATEEASDIAPADLWEKVAITELSQKLSFSPIKNIFKAISINERIFTQNELFDNNHTLFRSVLEQLEKMENFEDAVVFLRKGVAKDNNWESGTKIKKAEQFMKLVQRRFL